MSRRLPPAQPGQYLRAARARMERSTWSWVLIVFGAAILGGGLGALLGSQGNPLLDERGVIGAVLGAVIGTLLPRDPRVGGFERAFAAGMGVTVAVLMLVAVLPMDVTRGAAYLQFMVPAAMLGTPIIHWILRRVGT